MKLSTSDLDQFVSTVDTKFGGNLRGAEVEREFLPFDLTYRTQVDKSVDPFSDAYFDSQISLYRELAGRELDQWSGELHPVDMASLLNTANPQGITDVTHVAENVRSVSAMLSLCGLGPGARILDMGAGHGMSSEVYAFCGAQVHACDIDAKLSELSMMRAVRRSLPIRRSIVNFDSLAVLNEDGYDAAFFFQALHHALRPWKLIAELSRKLTKDGVVAFCGEPIQNDVWNSWGLRLDIESIYVARKFGWFESSWSERFISDCFARSGMTLALFSGGHQGGAIGIATKSAERLEAIRRRGAQLGHVTLESDPARSAAAANFHSQIGALSQRSGLGPFMRTQPGHAGGYLCFGPYASFGRGSYRVDFSLNRMESGAAADTASAVTFDIVSAGGTVTHHQQTIGFGPGERSRGIRVDLRFDQDVAGMETRVLVAEAGASWEMSLPRFNPV